MWGADADALDALAVELARRSDEVDRIYTELSAQLRAAPWQGSSANRFRDDWARVHRRQRDLVRDGLTEISETLRRNARQQRDASGGAGGAIGGGGAGGVVGAGGGSAVSAAELDRLRRELLAARGDPAAEARWWASLSPAEQAALLAGAPTALLAFEGLPADVRATAQARAVEAMKDTIGVVTDEVSADVRVNIPTPLKVDVVLGGGVSAARTEFADGHVEVTLTAEQLIGAGLSAGAVSAMIGVEGRASITWSFEDSAAADRFQRELGKALEPKMELDDALRWFTGSAVGGVAGGYAASVAPNVADVLRRHTGEVAHLKAEMAVTGEVSAKAAGASVDVSAAAGAEHDLKTGETTVFYELDGKVKGSLGPFTGARSGETRAELTFGSNGAPKEFVVSGSFATSTGMGLPAGLPVEASSLVGAGGSYALTVDLTDPVLAQDVDRFIAAVATGDSVGVASSFERLRNAGSVVLQSNVVNTTSVGVDLKVVSASVEHERTAALETWVKPAHGSFQQLASVPSCTGRSGVGGGW